MSCYIYIYIYDHSIDQLLQPLNGFDRNKSDPKRDERMCSLENMFETIWLGRCISQKHSFVQIFPPSPPDKKNMSDVLKKIFDWQVLNPHPVAHLLVI